MGPCSLSFQASVQRTGNYENHKLYETQEVIHPNLVPSAQASIFQDIQHDLKDAPALLALMVVPMSPVVGMVPRPSLPLIAETSYTGYKLDIYPLPSWITFLASHLTSWSLSFLICKTGPQDCCENEVK